MATLFDSASLVMIPSGVKEDKLYSIKPTDGSGDFTFSRGSDIQATRVNSSGLIEKAKVNDLLSSSDVSSQSTYWTANQGGVTTQNATTSPIGTNTATQITANGANNYSGVTQNVTMSAARFTYSVYLKAVSGSPQVRLTCFDGVTFHQTDFTLTTSWERYSITFSAAAGTNGVYITSTQAVSWYAWGAQLNYGQVAQDYVETTTTAVVEGLTADLPRLDYSGGASCPSLLLEPSRTNVVTQSDANANWNMVANVSNALTQDVVSPEGVRNAWAATRNINASGYTYMVNLSINTNTTYTASIFLKANDLSVCNQINFNLHGNSFAAKSTILSFVDGTATGDGVVEAYPNGWYRLSLTSVSNSSIGYFDVGLQPLLNGNANWGGSDGDVLWYGYGTQVEAGSYPTSYIPTYGTAAVRGADACVKTGISDLVGSQNGTIFLDFVYDNNSGNTRIFSLSGSTWNTAGSIRLEKSGTKFKWNWTLSGAATGTLDSTTDMVVGTRYKMAVSYTATSASLFVNGVKEDTDSVSTPSALTGIFLNELGGGFSDGFEFQKNLFNQVVMFQSTLTDAECIALTTI